MTAEEHGRAIEALLPDEGFYWAPPWPPGRSFTSVPPGRQVPLAAWAGHPTRMGICCAYVELWRHLGKDALCGIARAWHLGGHTRGQLTHEASTDGADAQWVRGFLDEARS